MAHFLVHSADVLLSAFLVPFVHFWCIFGAFLGFHAKSSTSRQNLEKVKVVFVEVGNGVLSC